MFNDRIGHRQEKGRLIGRTTAALSLFLGFAIIVLARSDTGVGDDVERLPTGLYIYPGRTGARRGTQRRHGAHRSRYLRGRHNDQ